jgi:hypothetical protein
MGFVVTTKLYCGLWSCLKIHADCLECQNPFWLACRIALRHGSKTVETLDIGHITKRNPLVCSGRSRLILRVQNRHYVGRTCLAQGEYQFLLCQRQKTKISVERQGSGAC